MTSRRALLIDDRRNLCHLAVADLENHLTLRTQVDGIGALEAHADPGGIGAGSQFEIVLQGLAFAVIDDVDAGIDARLAQASKRVRTAEVPSEVVGRDGGLVEAFKMAGIVPTSLAAFEGQLEPPVPNWM